MTAEQLAKIIAACPPRAEVFLTFGGEARAVRHVTIVHTETFVADPSEATKLRDELVGERSRVNLVGAE